MIVKKIITSDVRLLSLFTALGLYAVLSSPTPDSPGVVEAVIAGLLVVAALPGAWALVRGGLRMQTLWQAAGFVVLLYGLVVALSVGVARNELHYIVRDVLPFLFLFLPLFVTDLFVDRPGRGRFLLGFAALMGVLSALRALGQGIDAVLFLSLSEGVELYYLANAPTILFMACLALYGVLWGVSGGFAWRRAVVAGIALGACVLALLVMGLTLQRASLGYWFLYAVVVTGLVAWRVPRVLLFVVLLGVVVAVPLLPEVIQIFDSLIAKTQQFGLNNRAQEWSAVWDEVMSGGFLRILFGGGWGATFLSPAVAGERVNFTHGIMGAAILKMGLVGALLLALYLAGLLHMLWAVLRRHFIIGFAVLGPFMIDVLLYGAYKSLDFGVLLLLIPVALLSRFSDPK